MTFTLEEQSEKLIRAGRFCYKTVNTRLARQGIVENMMYIAVPNYSKASANELDFTLSMNVLNVKTIKWIYIYLFYVYFNMEFK